MFRHSAGAKPGSFLHFHDDFKWLYLPTSFGTAEKLNTRQLRSTGGVPDDSHPAFIGKLERGKAVTALWRAAAQEGLDSQPALQAAIAVRGPRMNDAIV
jgi:hypothetical protein